MLYRCAKQDPERRFHALFDKVARSDVMDAAWSDVRANKGAPGVDGISIEDVEALGVQVFLEELAADLRSGRYPAQAVAAGAHPQAWAAGTDPAVGYPDGP